MGIKKGGSYEREVCKQLSKWYSSGMFGEEKDDIFWRTAGSGARATTRMKKNVCTSNSCGDICALDKKGAKFTELCMIELKRGYGSKAKLTKSKKTGKSSLGITSGISLIDIIDKHLSKDKKDPKDPILIKWLRKANKEATSNSIPNVIVIFKRDRRRSCIVLNLSLWKTLQENNSSKWIFPNNGTVATIHHNEFGFVVIGLEDFLTWCNPKAFFKKLPKIKRREPWAIGKYGGERIRKMKG